MEENYITSHLTEANADCGCYICQSIDPEIMSAEFYYEDYSEPEETVLLQLDSVVDPVGGSSYISGGRRHKRRAAKKRGGARSGGSSIGGRVKHRRRKAKGGSANPFIRFMNKHRGGMVKKYPDASPQMIMKALAKMYRSE